MKKFSIKMLVKLLVKQISILPALLILCSLPVFANALTRQHWNRNYFVVNYNKDDNSLEMQFQFFDYHFGPDGENGFLRNCLFAYSTDGENFHYFMRSTTTDQMHFGDWSWVKMSDKLPGAKIHFGKCYIPGEGTRWIEDKYYIIQLFNSDGGKAWFNVKWYLEDKYRDIKFIRLYGVWHVHGINENDHILGVDFEINKLSNVRIKAEVNDSIPNQVRMPVIDQPENNKTQVSKHEDSIVVKGAEPGQNIKVYTTSGALVQSIVANDDVVKIPLSTDQIYILHLEHVRYKVAL